MWPFRRSLTTWCLSTHIWRLWCNSGDRRLHTLEIGERQVNDRRLHRLPDVLPFCQPGVPFNTPILSLAPTSSLPITWSVHKPPVLSLDLTTEKTKKSNHRRSTWHLYRFSYVHTLCFSDAPPTPSLIKRHVASSTVVFNRRLRFLQRSKPLNPSRYSLFHHLSSSSSIPNAFSVNHKTSRLSQSSTFFSIHPIIKR